MKIVALGPVYPYRGGIAAYHTLLIQALAQAHQVEVVSFSRQYPRWLYPGQSDKDYRQNIPTFPIRYMLDSINPWSWYHTAKWISQQKPNLIIIEWWVTFLAPAYFMIANYCRRRGIKVLFNIHNVLPHDSGRYHRPLAILALSQADFHLTHTPIQRQLLLDLCPLANVKTIPLPVFPSDGRPIVEDERKEARQILGLPLDSSILLFFGIVRPYKGLMVLIEAMANLRTYSKSVCLLVAGEFWEKKDIFLAAINQLNLSNYVRLEDRFIPDDEVRRYFAAANLVIAPYTGGTQSAIVSLARGYGVPIVLTEYSAAGLEQDQIDPNTIAHAGDAQDLARAIDYSLKNPQSYHSYRTDGWSEVVEMITRLF